MFIVENRNIWRISYRVRGIDLGIPENWDIPHKSEHLAILSLLYNNVYGVHRHFIIRIAGIFTKTFYLKYVSDENKYVFEYELTYFPLLHGK